MPNFLIQTTISRLIEADDEDDALSCAEEAACGMADVGEMCSIKVIPMDELTLVTR
jgi:hypothetical protein